VGENNFVQFLEDISSNVRKYAQQPTFFFHVQCTSQNISANLFWALGFNKFVSPFFKYLQYVTLFSQQTRVGQFLPCLISTK